ncbi:LLM class flavin-dependent oxidoreductase [Alkalihalobacillus oceani]|uniref:LLM class flavin-dependent oxidoreductase n=1 Tax=Halalkalibacter oceani TaxID=1653776 RepID=UPI0020401333|nr:LLM class flavin-dependent oxidoreductase [Halalkalibacter oceani]MCM3761423.1 LLM class flavin-dependent oxidoreductase [Halalkalibacter oceani]
MKFVFMNLMSYRDLPEDFTEKYKSVYISLPNKVYDPEKGHQMYNDFIDQYELAIDLGFDGVGVNEHHANAYGMMPSPNLIAATLARKVKDSERTVLIVLGNSLALYNPPIRVAEELAMLDNISGGRLIAGFPVGTSMDTNYAYGINPAELRPRYYEAHDLIMKAWKEREVFHFNGEFNQLRYVNVWTRPYQEPHPPVWIPGGAASQETFDWVAENDYQYSYLSFYGHEFAKDKFDKFWERRKQLGLDMNPYKVGFVQMICISETDEKAKEEYEEHINYFFEKSFHVSPEFLEAPGYRTEKSVRAGMQSQYGTESAGAKLRAGLNWEQMVEGGYIIAGSPESVIKQIRKAIKKLHVGHFIALLNHGSMPHELALKNIRLMGEEVIPHVRDIWGDQYEVQNWPEVTEKAAVKKG